MRVNEILYTLQGEGYNTGKAAVFVRLAGCNLQCPFCDTNHHTFVEMTEDAIVEAITQHPANMTVITGGEPALQLTETLIAKIHAIGKTVAVETNGTMPLPPNVDWVTVSPKELYVGPEGRSIIKKANEVKVVFDGTHKISDLGIEADHYYVQPCDTGNIQENKVITEKCASFVKAHPRWQLSLQTHKYIGIE